MSAYVKFVCYFCGESEIESEIELDNVDSIESVYSLLWEFGWDTSDGYLCRLCNV